MPSAAHVLMIAREAVLKSCQINVIFQLSWRFAPRVWQLWLVDDTCSPTFDSYLFTLVCLSLGIFFYVRFWVKWKRAFVINGPTEQAMYKPPYCVFDALVFYIPTQKSQINASKSIFHAIVCWIDKLISLLKIYTFYCSTVVDDETSFLKYLKISWRILTEICLKVS